MREGEKEGRRERVREERREGEGRKGGRDGGRMKEGEKGRLLQCYASADTHNSSAGLS